MARKPKAETIRVRCTALFKKRVERVADKRDTTSSEITRKALMEKLEREEKALGIAPTTVNA